MGTTRSLMSRAQDIKDEVERRILLNGGQVTGTITEIRRCLELSCPNNELREALSILIGEGRLKPKEVHRAMWMHPAIFRTYRYVLQVDLRQQLLEQLKAGPIEKPVSTTGILEGMGLTDVVSEEDADQIIFWLKADKIIKAPLVAHKSDSRPLSKNVYLFMELVLEPARELSH